MKYSLFILIILIVSCDKTDPDNPFDANFNGRGCLECDNYLIGESFLLDNVRYVVADKNMIIDALDNNEDLSRFCTSRITYMSELFKDYETFNQNISVWDVSNVLNMRQMFIGLLALIKI